eukprot:UN27595
MLLRWFSQGGWFSAMQSFFCSDCWGQWLKSEIERQGPKSVGTKCPYFKCGLVVPATFYDKFLSPNRKYWKYLKMYKKYVQTMFIQGCNFIKPCPGVNCDYAVAYELGGAHPIQCKCGHLWCFGCNFESHNPASCDHAQKWEEKNSSDSENVNWIMANTKKCPKCKTNIEKNQGCMHMTCRQCRHEFCWLCKGDWRGHSACNKTSWSETSRNCRTEIKKSSGALSVLLFST